MLLSNVEFPREKQIARCKSSADILRHNSGRLRPALPRAKVTDRRVHLAGVQFWHFFAQNRLTAPAGGPSAPDRVVLRPSLSHFDLQKSFLFRYLPTHATADCAVRSTLILLYRHRMFIGYTACIRRECRVCFLRAVRLSIMNTACWNCDLQPLAGRASSEAFRPALQH